jgi:hypothetical protein
MQGASAAGPRPIRTVCSVFQCQTIAPILQHLFAVKGTINNRFSKLSLYGFLVNGGGKAQACFSFLHPL